MKTHILRGAGLFSMLVLFFTASSFTSAPRWEKLGSRTVKHKLDRDEILVTAYEGTFTALRLKAEKSDINLHKFTVYYRNGKPQTLNVRQTIRAGSYSRALDLNGRRRIITKVVFWYDTKGYEKKKGRVELWGRH